MNLKTLPPQLQKLAAHYAQSTAHKHEPFPLYKPITEWDKITFNLIKIRWWLIKRFVKHKSFLNGQTLY